MIPSNKLLPYSSLRSNINLYEAILPHAPLASKSPQMPLLQKSLLLKIATDTEPLIPVARRKHGLFKADAKLFRKTEIVKIEWKRLEDGVYFDNLKEQYRAHTADTTAPCDVIQNVLINCGFPFTTLPLSLIKRWEECKLHENLQWDDIRSRLLVSASTLVEFLKQQSTTQLVGAPRLVAQTPFLSPDAVRVVFDYVKTSLNRDKKDAGGLPLLLTQDAILREFAETDEPILSSRHHGLLPQLRHKFLHSVYIELPADMESLLPGFVKEMQIADFAQLLSHELDPVVYYQTPTAEYPNEENKAGKARIDWLCRCYNFLCEKSVTLSDIDGKKTAEALRPLDDWCVVPADIGPKRVLKPVREAGYIFDTYSANELKLHNLPVPRAFYPNEMSYGANIKQVLRKLTANVHSRPFIALQALHRYLTTDFCNVEEEAANAILEFFNRNLSDIQRDPRVRPILRELPIYVTATGRMIRVSDAANIHLLPEDVRVDGLEKLALTTTVLLSGLKLHSFEKLYKFIGCTPIDIKTYYVSYILPHADTLTLKEIHQHLLSLRDRESLWKLWGISNNFLHHLKQLRFMEKTDGSRYPASSFYDPTVELFRLMQNTDDFPIEPYNEEEWMPFLKQIGLITDVTEKICVRYANDIAQGKHNADEISEVLVTHIKSHDQHEKLFMSVKHIAFLPRKEIAEKFTKIAAGDTKHDLVSYNSATSEEYAEVCWTVLPILHDWATPISRVYDVILKPAAGHVQKHIRCLHAVQKNKLTTATIAAITSVQDIYIKCLEYVTKLQLSDPILSKFFGNVPVVISDSGHFIKASHLVMEQETGWDGLEPLISKLPIQFGGQRDVLRRLGMTDKITFGQVVTQLNELHRASAGEVLGPNQAQKALMLTFKLFRMLEQDKEASISVTELHLLTHQSAMRAAGEVLIVDNKNVAEQKFAGGLPIIADLSLKIDGSSKFIAPYVQLQAIEKLPEALRPKPLSAVISEVLDEACLQEVVPSALAEELQEKLAMPEFHHCLMSLKQYNVKSSDPIVEELLSEIGEALKCIKFIGLRRVETRFEQNGKTVGSKQTRKFYISRDVALAKIQIYISWKKQSSMAFLTNLSKTILSLPLFRECGSGPEVRLHIRDLLNAAPNKVMETFGEFDIPLYGSPKVKTNTTVPDPGDYVPQEYLHMLEMTFARLAVGDYVAYIVDDPFISGDTENTTETYIYAKVLKVILPEGQADDVLPMLYKYEIDVGKANIVVPSLDLYRFKEYIRTDYDQTEPQYDVTSLQQFTGNTDAPSSSYVPPAASAHPGTSGSAQSDNENPQTLEEVKAYIKKCLIEAKAQNFDKTQRKKLYKRLYLKFHPDKNPHRVDIATEAFKYLQKMIDRLEDGKQLDDEDSDLYNTGRSGFRSSQSKNSSYFNENFKNNSYFREKFRRDKHHEQNFTGFNFGKRSRRRRRGRFQSEAGASREGSHDGNNSNPQPGVARRWITQARYDLNAVNCDQLHNNYEWAAYKCHQAAKKATRAAQFKTDASYSEPQYATLTACECDDLMWKLRQEIGPADDMQYPSDTSWEAFSVPHKRYTEEMARNSVEITKEIVDNCERFISNA